MLKIYADLHIHIGASQGQAVKITAARTLTLEQVLFRDAPALGLHMAAVVDAACSGVCGEIEALLAQGRLAEVPGGGLLAENQVMLIPASEFETREGAHFLAYLPDMAAIHAWQRFLHPRVSNTRLSTQKARAGIAEALSACSDAGGIFCPAHAFTPHKGFYGAVAPRLDAVLGSRADEVRVVELGLSADTRLAAMISETDSMSFISNSDAHSSKNVGREFNLLTVGGISFAELRQALQGENGREISANFGFNPLLGKYHRTSCLDCGCINDESQAASACFSCGSSRVVMGVYDRILNIADRESGGGCGRKPHRPPYHYRVPLHELPGIGPRALQVMLGEYRALEIMESVPLDAIQALAGARAAAAIGMLRSGRYQIQPGGGGRYGRIKAQK